MPSRAPETPMLGSKGILVPPSINSEAAVLRPETSLTPSASTASRQRPHEQQRDEKSQHEAADEEELEAGTIEEASDRHHYALHVARPLFATWPAPYLIRTGAPWREQDGKWAGVPVTSGRR